MIENEITGSSVGYHSRMWTKHPVSGQRLSDEPIGWLTTVSNEGKPSTAPVWYILEDDDTISIYSKDPSTRVKNLEANGNVTMHLEGNGVGGAIVVVNAKASIDRAAPPPSTHRAFVAKYQSFLDDYGWTPEIFARDYPTMIRLTPTSVRGS